MRTIVLLSAFLLPAFLGCGGAAPGPATFVTSGKVTCDDKPLPKGRAEFISTGGKGNSAGTDVVNGTYKVSLQPGSYKVAITAFEVAGKEKIHPGDPTSGEQDIHKQYVASEFNEKSTLTCDVTTAAKTQDFAVKREPAK